MNLKLLKKYFLTKELNKHINNRRFSEGTTSLKRIGVIFKNSDEITEEVFQSLVEALSILPKDLKIIYYKEEKKNLPTLDENIISSRDFNWKGELIKPSVIEFLDREYDVFIGYYNEKNVYMDLVSASANAPLKVGLDGGNAALFDLVFSVKPNEYKVFERELVKYLNILKNKK